MIIADVGEHRQEEIDFAPKGKGAGANYGWRVFEGNLRIHRHEQAPRAVKPALTYPHTNHRCAIVGGHVIRDPSLPALVARYLYGDYCTGELRTVKLSAGKARDDQPLPLRVPSLTSFGQDTTGRLYATSFYGAVYRLAPSG